MRRTSFYIERKSPAALIAVIFMILTIAIRTVYFTVTGITTIEIWLHYILPLSAAILMIFIITKLGYSRPKLSALSVLMFIIFFIARAFTFDSRIQTILCIIMYITILTVYNLTIFGIIPTKYLLYPLAGLPLLYHIFIEDMKLYVFAEPPVPFIEWLPEMSVLCIISALLCVAISIKKKKQ